jgi:hypothetical protein
MPNPLDSRASAKKAALVDFFWFTEPDEGEDVHARYTTWTDDIQAFALPGDPIFTSEPRLQIELPEDEATLDDREARVLMPLNYPFNEIAEGIPYPRNMRMHVYRVDPDDENDTLQLVWAGLVSSLTPNHEGNPLIAEIVVQNLLYQLHVSASVPADTQCIWRFGDPLTCGANIASLIRAVIITAISDFQVQVSGIPTLEKQKARWKRGYLDIDGGTSLIRNFNDGGDVCLLNRRLPQSLVGRQVRLVPGCSKLLTSCRFWQTIFPDIELRFAGYGYGTPAYNPTFETG